MGYSAIDYKVVDNIATITLNDPQTRNAFSQLMEDELRASLSSASGDPEVRAIILTGAGNTFCIGGNVGDLQKNNLAEATLSPPPRPPQTNEIGENYARRFTYLLGVSKPMFAAINGAIAGVGLTIALYCDIRYMVDNAKLTTSFAKRGLIAEQGTAWMLPRLIGPMNALDLLLSSRVVTGSEAARLGLVRALPAEGFQDSVRASVREIAELCSPRSTGLIRRQVYDSMFQTLAEGGFAAELEERDSFTSEDFAEGVAHFLEKRKPRFTGR